MRAVVLVHGLWHGPWCWSAVTPLLAARGIPSVAVDVEGHGLSAPSRSVTLSSAAAVLLDQLRLIGGGEPCVVVGHSVGGTIATVAAELEPSLFDHLVFVTSVAPVGGGLSMADYVVSPDNDGDLVRPMLVGDPAVTGALRLPPPLSARKELRAAFGSSDAAIALLTPDAPLGLAVEPVTVTPARFGSVPHSYVVCSEDMVVRPALQRRIVRELDQISAGPTTVVELPATHSPFLSHPAELADVIAAAW
ncbi:alpha/beta fold hydrolase [Actinoplanes solisilvae]|uniref:alpha/beta fold hydrolase n=1 Tax=Actinoplanes solisilvae TaxID=2486853 RepID=UPI000FD8C474|nr:alpha/beta fold hydrolase [Actinoplanes solisilvae]